MKTLLFLATLLLSNYGYTEVDKDTEELKAFLNSPKRAKAKKTKHQRLKDFIDNVTIQLDAGYTVIEHSWDDKYGYALFKPEMVGVGITAWHSSNIGVRLAHGVMDEEHEQSGGNYKFVSLKFTGITSLELLYKYYPTNNTYVFAGIGTYLIPMDHVYWKDGKRVGGRPDRDDDEGYFIGVNSKVFKNFGIELKYNHFSQIGDDEYVKGVTLSITGTF